MTKFEWLINNRGIHIGDIAKVLHLSRTTIYRKLKNNTFTYDEMAVLRDTYFSIGNIDSLFAKYDENA